MATDQADRKTVRVVGPATIYEASTLRDVLRLALAEDRDRDLDLDLQESGKWDIACLQLLISAARTAQDQGRTVRLRNVPRSCAEVAARSGLDGWLASVSG